jgi:hypothetical protein
MKIEIPWQAIKLFYRKRYILCVCATHRFAEQVPVKAHIIFSTQTKLTLPTSEIGIDDNVITPL